MVKAKDTYGYIYDRVKNTKKTFNDHNGHDANASAQNANGDETAEPMETNALVAVQRPLGGDGFAASAAANQSVVSFQQTTNAQQLVKKQPQIPRPKWHAPWKLKRVMVGHLGWVRCVTVDPSNDFIATGAADRVIKIWDLATGQLRISLTGHVSTVRGLAVSKQYPYLFSCGEDRQVKCWDLETNKVIRHYHGHLSAVYSLALHPTIGLLVSAGRDSTARVWDIRTKTNIHTLVGHTNTVASVVCQSTSPQVITGSHDSTVRLWDLAAGKSLCTLTNHKKSVRSVALHPAE